MTKTLVFGPALPDILQKIIKKPVENNQVKPFIYVALNHSKVSKGITCPQLTTNINNI